MPRFYFHVQDGRGILDRQGLVFPNRGAARAEAISAAGEMIRDLHGKMPEDGWRMCVTDSDGRTVLALHFRAEDLT